jgi:NAD(P)-dependent dehydrogenase (short-subunit alcohol dehydrogenase family)
MPDLALTGKVCLISGATAGIGAVTAQALAGRGATVVVVGRNPEKSRAVANQIRQKTHNPNVDCLLADLSVQQQVRHLAETFKSRYDRLDILINNAGAVFFKRHETPDGLERTFALNHLNYFLLTNLLLDRLQASAPARIINVSSAAHYAATISFNNLQYRRWYFGGWPAYAQSKLANILFTYELARRLEGTGVIANTLHPGLVATNFGANNGWVGRLFRLAMNPISVSPTTGAQTMIYLATSPQVEGITGKYFDGDRPFRSSRASYNETTARRLWEISEELTGLRSLSFDSLP